MGGERGNRQEYFNELILHIDLETIGEHVTTFT